ncbi:MAG: sugar transferase [Acutalibacteraceae bacterium]
MNKEELTKAQRWQIAELLAEERLDAVNKLCEDVHPKDTFYTRYGKRALDIIFSGIALCLSLPFNLVIGIITYFDVGRPIFFKQERTGKDQKPFQLIKFRNMRNTTDDRGELLPPEQRVTKFGKFVRRLSLDELLNFWSVFKGDMSLIGPRPLVPEYLCRYNKRHKMRLAVRPGLECPPRTIPDRPVTWQDQFENDIWYVENVSFFTDCYMIFQLFRFALNRKNTKVRSTGKRGIFMGYDWNGTAITMAQIDEEVLEKYESRLSAEEGQATIV